MALHTEHMVKSNQGRPGTGRPGCLMLVAFNVQYILPSEDSTVFIVVSRLKHRHQLLLKRKLDYTTTLITTKLKLCSVIIFRF